MIRSFLTYYGYYFFLGVGALSMLMLMQLRRESFRLNRIKASAFTCILLACGIAGAKLLFFLESGGASFNGMSFFGAVFLVPLLMPLVGMLLHLTPAESLDACAPCVASIIGFMRLGCYCADCCGGIVTTWRNIMFRWPTQLMEGFGDIFILLLLLHFEQQGRHRGQLYPVFLLSYGILRFCVEFLRNTPKDFLGFAQGQWFSLVAVLLALYCLFLKNGGSK